MRNTGHASFWLMATSSGSCFNTCCPKARAAHATSASCPPTAPSLYSCCKCCTCALRPVRAGHLQRHPQRRPGPRPGPPGDAPAANPCACCSAACRRSSPSQQATLTATPRGPGDPPPNQPPPARPTHATGPMRRGSKRCPEHHDFALDASGLDQAPQPPHARQPAPTRVNPKIRPRRPPGEAIRRHRRHS